MREIPFNLQLLTTMLEEVNQYLLSNETFWPLGSSEEGESFPRLSLGQLLLTRDELRVQAEDMEPEQIDRYTDLDDRWQEIKRERPANLEKKALSEVSQRQNLWRAYLQDIHESSQAARSYPTDVRHRVLLTRLQTFVSDEDELDAVREVLRAMDNKLRSVFRSGSFVWHPRLIPLYSEQEYWFLYGEPVPQG